MLEWTKDVPTQRGYYWHYPDWGTRICTIKEITLWDGIPQVDNGIHHWPASDTAFVGWWFGPIEPPEPPYEPKA